MHEWCDVWSAQRSPHSIKVTNSTTMRSFEFLSDDELHKRLEENLFVFVVKWIVASIPRDETRSAFFWSINIFTSLLRWRIFRKQKNACVVPNPNISLRATMQQRVCFNEIKMHRLSHVAPIKWNVENVFFDPFFGRSNDGYCCDASLLHFTRDKLESRNNRFMCDSWSSSGAKRIHVLR